MILLLLLLGWGRSTTHHRGGGGGAKPGTVGMCVVRERPGRAETAPQSFSYDAAVGGGCTNGIMYGSVGA